MKNKILLLFLLLYGLSLSAQTIITGKITDKTEEPLIGVNIKIAETTEGTITDPDGAFTLATKQALPLNLKVSYLGFKTQKIKVTDRQPLNIVLEDDAIMLDDGIVISASRRPEKIQDAPASIAVIGTRQLEASAQTEPIRNLINTPGVQIQQQSAARINIEMRGSAGLFGTGVFPILDYRSLIGPGLGTFQSDAAGISNIDIAKIEVVKGPGSALYGPSVTSGVVHFISKNPIDYPGTTVEVGGGQLNTLVTAVRHAGKNKKENFGYKINAGFNRGNEFTLDPNDPEDSLQISKFKQQIIQPRIVNGYATFEAEEVLLTMEELDKDGDGNPMADDWWNAFANATLEFRPQKDLSLFLSGGYNQASAVFYNSQGEGLSQAKELWGQARVQKGGFFAQAFYVTNDGGSKENPTFLYQTGNRTSLGRDQFEAQVQYNFDVPKLFNGEFTTGVDYRLTKSKTFNLVYGRNEDKDDYSIIGGYVQGKFEISKKIDVLLAGRYDQFNFINEGTFAPRAAIVYKHNPKHTIRATYNKSSSPNQALEAYIDFPLADAGPFAIWLLGNQESVEWNDEVGTTLFVEGNPTVPNIGIPTNVAYGAITPELIPAIQAFVEGNESTAPLWPILEEVLLNTSLSGYSEGITIDTDGTPLSLQNVSTSSVRIDHQVELGYKGLIGDKLGITTDVYWISRKNFTDLGTITPLVAIPNLPTDLEADVVETFTPQIKQALLDAGFSEAEAESQSNLYGIILGQAYEDAANEAGLNSTIGLVDGIDRLPDFEKPLMAWGYRSFPDEYHYWGVDFGVEYYITEDFSVFGNYSYINQTEFTAEDLGEAGSGRSIYLSQPSNKFRIGTNYAPTLGFRGSLSFQHDDEFYADYGQYAGITQAKNLVDASVGYKFDFGLTFSASATNLLNQEYRAFVGFPKIGRRVIGKIRYDF